MSLEPEHLERIRANTAFVVGTLGELSGLTFGLDAASVAWVEGFIERQRPSLDEEAADKLISVLGSYLGEALIAAVPGARWENGADGAVGVIFPTGDMAFPFHKVAKQVANGVGLGDSIQSFYRISVDFVATGKLRDRPRDEGQ